MASRVRAALAVATVFACAPGVASAADLQASPGNLGSVFGSAQGGDVIHLAAGDYGDFAGGRKPSTVTLLAGPGVTATMSPDLNAASYVRFQGLTITAAAVGGGSDHIDFVGNRFTGSTVVNTGNATMNVTFDGDTFDGINVCSSCYEGRLTVVGNNGTTPNGVRIMNSHFSGGNSDGIQITGYAYGTQIGPGNQFIDIVMIDDTHTDAIQLYHSSHTLITGNYLHGNETGIMAPDGADHETITDNVITTKSYPWPIVLGSDDGTVIQHNTFPDGSCEFNMRCGVLRVYGGNANVASKNTVVRDNIIGQLDVTGASAEDHNLVARGTASGAADIKGLPTYNGGAAPKDWQGFRLADGSLGKANASDGLDRGAAIPSPAGTPAPAQPGRPQGVASAVGPPVISLLAPVPGARFFDRLRVGVSARDDSGIKRVELWLDRRRLASDTRLPYRFSRRVSSRTRSGRHTLSVRAIAKDGQVSSTAVTARRARRGHGTRVAAWRVTAARDGALTQLKGRGPARRRVSITLVKCSDRRARTVARLRLRSGSDGRVSATRTGALCVAGVR